MGEELERNKQSLLHKKDQMDKGSRATAEYLKNLLLSFGKKKSPV